MYVVVGRKEHHTKWRRKYNQKKKHEGTKTETV